MTDLRARVRLYSAKEGGRPLKPECPYLGCIAMIDPSTRTGNDIRLHLNHLAAPVQPGETFEAPISFLTTEGEERLIEAGRAFLWEGRVIGEIEMLPESPLPDLIDMVRGYSEEIQNGRTIDDVIRHIEGDPDRNLVGELDELKDEVRKLKEGLPQGEDGVVGEAIDLILCLLDLITVASPQTTKRQILTIARAKCEKWKLHYSKSIDRVRA